MSENFANKLFVKRFLGSEVSLYILALQQNESLFERIPREDEKA